jgi:sulfide:quinone oxidoreductase
MGVTDDKGYLQCNQKMRVMGQQRIYAAGDCVNFVGPKMGHMAVRQAEVAALNLAAEIEGREPLEHYSHEMRFVIDEIGSNGSNGIYVQKNLSADGPAAVREGRFWSWAKKVHKEFWEAKHS